MNELLPELVELTLLELEPNEVARLLATSKAFFSPRERYWRYYWSHRPFRCEACYELKTTNDADDMIVVGFDVGEGCTGGLLCALQHPGEERECWIFCTINCFDEYSFACITDVHHGHLVRLHERTAKYRNWLICCHRTIAWPAWPTRREDYKPTHSW